MINDCPSIYELTTTPLEDDQQLHAHVNECLRCRTLLATWEDAQADAGANGEAPPWPMPDGAFQFDGVLEDPSAPPAVGAVHVVGAPDSDRFLVAVVSGIDDASVTVLPVSAETWLAADEDVLLRAEVLGYPAMVERWNRVDVLVEQVGDRLSDPTETLLLIVDTNASADVLVETGPPITAAADPRSEFREDEQRRVRRYAEPARRLRTADTFAGVVRQRRLEAKHELEATAGLLDLPPLALQRLEEDLLDLFVELPVPKLHRLLDHLELHPSRELYSLVEKAAFRNDNSSGYGQELSFARRRAGSRSRPPHAPEDVRRQHARQYVDALRRRLEA